MGARVSKHRVWRTRGCSLCIVTSAGGDGRGGETGTPTSWAGISLLTVRWGGNLHKQAGLGAGCLGTLFPGARPLPWAFPGYSPGGCGKPTCSPRGARETAEGAAAGKSQVKGWRTPVVGSPAFPHEEPSGLTPQESELSKKRKKCESLEQEARKKQRRCEELVSSGGPPRSQLPCPPGQQGDGLPLSSAFTPLALKNTLPLLCSGAVLSWQMQAPGGGGRSCLGGRVLCVGRGGMWVPCPLPGAPLVSQELQLKEAQNENARLVDENSRLSGRATQKEQVATLPRCCAAWDPARAWVPGEGLSPPVPTPNRAGG